MYANTTFAVIVGADPVTRAQCRRRLALNRAITIIAEGDTAAAISDQHLPLPSATTRGVVLLVGALYCGGEDLTAAILGVRRVVPAMPVLVVSEPPPVIDAHVAGWVSLGSPIDLAAAAIAVASGGWISDRAKQLEPQRLLPHLSIVDAVAPSPLTTLTPREMIILAHLVQGQTPAEIAVVLAISLHIVKSSLRHISQKLHAHDHIQATTVASRSA